MGGNGGRSKDNFFSNTGVVPMSDKESDIKSSPLPIGVTGQRSEKGTETYIEIKGPTGVGDKSSTPYTKVLPKYKKQAEKALQRQRIPREHQKKVKDYFNSLGGG
jgi:hypothetical protein